MAIKTFKCADTEALFRLRRVARFANFERPALRKLKQLDLARRIEDLRAPPANRLELLKGRPRWAVERSRERPVPHLLQLDGCRRPGRRDRGLPLTGEEHEQETAADIARRDAARGVLEAAGHEQLSPGQGDRRAAQRIGEISPASAPSPPIPICACAASSDFRTAGGCACRPTTTLELPRHRLPRRWPRSSHGWKRRHPQRLSPDRPHERVWPVGACGHSADSSRRRLVTDARNRGVDLRQRRARANQVRLLDEGTAMPAPTIDQYLKIDKYTRRNGSATVRPTLPRDGQARRFDLQPRLHVLLLSQQADAAGGPGGGKMDDEVLERFVRRLHPERDRRRGRLLVAGRRADAARPGILPQGRRAAEKACQGRAADRERPADQRHAARRGLGALPQGASVPRRL